MSLTRRSRYGSQRLDVTRSTESFRSYGRHSALRLEAVQILQILKTGSVYLTGGRDRHGGPIFYLPAKSGILELSEENLSTYILYLSSIPGQESAANGFRFLIDNRYGTFNGLAEGLLAMIQKTLNGSVRGVYIVQHNNADKFRLSKEQSPYGFEVVYMSMRELDNVADVKELTRDLGGTLPYIHDSWISSRISIETCVKDSVTLSSELDAACHRTFEILKQFPLTHQLRYQLQAENDSLINSTLNAINQGRDLHGHLISEGETNAPGNYSQVRYTLDQVAALNQIKQSVEKLESKLAELETLWKGQQKRREPSMRSMQDNELQRTELELAIKTVVDWILGPAEKLLSSQTGIGTSFETADELRKHHEQLELKCTDSYGTYAELRHKVTELEEEGSRRRSSESDPSDIKAQRDYMDMVCRSFASRLEKRRNLVITSVRFHRLIEELDKLIKDLNDVVLNEPIASDVQTAESLLKHLEEKIYLLNITTEKALNEGQSLLDQLCLPVKDAFGKDITPDRKEQTNHVDSVIDSLQDRKQKCDDVVDFYRLRLQQILQLRTCERDADKAINWILELCDIAGNKKSNASHSPKRFRGDDNKNIDDIAQNSYDYGKQLLQTALVLRRSMNHDIAPNTEQSQKLAQAWNLFKTRPQNAGSTSEFAHKVDMFLNRVDEVMAALSKTANSELSRDELVVRYSPLKDRLVSEQRQLRGQALEIIKNLQNSQNMDPR